MDGWGWLGKTRFSCGGGIVSDDVPVRVQALSRYLLTIEFAFHKISEEVEWDRMGELGAGVGV